MEGQQLQQGQARLRTHHVGHRLSCPCPSVALPATQQASIDRTIHTALHRDHSHEQQRQQQQPSHIQSQRGQRI
jgi:hypothetical protein